MEAETRPIVGAVRMSRKPAIASLLFTAIPPERGTGVSSALVVGQPNDVVAPTRLPGVPLTLRRKLVAVSGVESARSAESLEHRQMSVAKADEAATPQTSHYTKEARRPIWEGRTPYTRHGSAAVGRWG